MRTPGLQALNPLQGVAAGRGRALPGGVCVAGGVQVQPPTLQGLACMHRGWGGEGEPLHPWVSCSPPRPSVLLEKEPLIIVALPQGNVSPPAAGGGSRR